MFLGKGLLCEFKTSKRIYLAVNITQRCEITKKKKKVTKGSCKFLMVTVCMNGRHRSTNKPSNYVFKLYGSFLHHLTRGRYVL